MANNANNSSPVVVPDQFHFSHFYYEDDGVSMTSVSEDESYLSEDEDFSPRLCPADLKLRFSHQVLGDENIHFGKWDASSRKNLADKDSFRQATESMTDHMFELAQSLQPHCTKTMRIVDLGSGTAAAAQQIVARSVQPSVNVTCLNLCRQQNRRAQLSLNPDLAKDIQVVTGNFEAPPFEAHEFDVVFSQDALWHAPDKRQVYQEAYRICRPGGALVICDLVAGPNNDESDRFARRLRLRDWQTADQAVQQLQAAGWIQAQAHDVTDDLVTSFQAMKCCVQKLIKDQSTKKSKSPQVLERALLESYLDQIDQRLEQVEGGLLGWAILTARKPIQLQLGLPKLPNPLPASPNFGVIPFDSNEDSSDAHPNAVVVDILHPVNAATVKSWPSSVQALVTLSAGLDHIDTAACRKAGIAVYQAGRQAITNHVAEYVTAFVVLGLRHALDQEGVPFPQRGHWNLNWNVHGTPLEQATVAIIGMGLIGQEIVRRLRALVGSSDGEDKLKILYHVPAEFRDLQAETKYQLEYCDNLVDMAGQCDVLVPMCPLTPSTTDLVNADVLEALGPESGLINMSRGSVVNTAALTNALESKKIAYAILDTTAPEPLPADHPLWSQSNCHIFPHYATNTPAVRRALVEDIEPLVVRHFGLDVKSKSSSLLCPVIPPAVDQVRYDLAVAHRLTAHYGMDMTVWNHISARINERECLITPGRRLWSQITPDDLVVSSTNVTADIIHAAIYGSRPDVGAVIHLHTPNAVAVSCLDQGFVPMTQDAAYFYNKVADYDWDGLSNDESEGPAIQEAVQQVPGCNTLLMKQHGFCCFGRTVKEAWTLAYYFERACEIQIKVLQTGAPVCLPRKAVMEQAARDSYLPEFAPGECEWDALSETITF